MDHVRGSSLAWPESLDVLRPFIVTWWSGRTISDMPSDVRAVYDQANFGTNHINLALTVVDEKGKLLRSTVPFVQPPAFQFDPAAQGRSFKSQLDSLLKDLPLPKIQTQPKLNLPDVIGEGQPAGVRLYLTFGSNRLNHYRTPTVEVVPMTDALRKSLSYSSQEHEIKIADIQPWLEQMYPPAIMDGFGGFAKITGKLIASPAGKDDDFRYLLVKGDVTFELDNRGRSGYSGKLDIVLRYPLQSSELHSIRGVMVSEVPKGPEMIQMTVAIESRPK